MTHEQVLEAWRRGGASRDRVLVKLSQEDVLGWATRLLPGPAESRRLAATLLSRSPHPEDALTFLQRLATDGDRHTRDAAAHAAGGLLIQHFDEVYPILGAWRTDSNPLVRRAVVLIAGVAADPLRLDRVGPLLRLLDPLLTDRAIEVRSALEGVFSHALFAAYPDDTFECLTCWSASHDEQVLWHVATALAGAPSPMARRALIVLRRVALDERRYVRGAVARALVRLAVTCPDAVAGELRRWLEDPERGSIAREALGRIDEEVTGSKPVAARSRSAG
ncbi:MAG: HEAT repeat domain-containing protein [Candidatus Bipolaricaulota bacterium]